MVNILIIPAAVVLAGGLNSAKIVDEGTAVTIPAIAAGIYAGSLFKRSAKASLYLGAAGLGIGGLWYLANRQRNANPPITGSPPYQTPR